MGKQGSEMRSDVVVGMAEVTQISAFPGVLIRLCAFIAPCFHPWYLKHFTNICPVSHRHTPVYNGVYLLKPLKLYQHHLVS